MVGALVIDTRKPSYPPIWLLFEQGCAQVAAGAPFAVGAGGCCGLACGQDPAMSDARPHRRLRLPRPCPWSRPPAGSGRFRRKWAPISPWALDFCAVFGGGRSLLASPTRGNAGVLWRFGPIRPAKPPRSCERDSLASEVAHLGVCFGFVGAGRRHCDHLSSKTKLADCGGRRVAHRRS